MVTSSLSISPGSNDRPRKGPSSREASQSGPSKNGIRQPVSSGESIARPKGLLVTEFRLLGLRPREARLDVIRGALRASVSHVKSGDQPSDGDGVARVAVAGYRLLDPRRRRTLYERVQLLLWSEDDFEAPHASLWSQPTDPLNDASNRAVQKDSVVTDVASVTPPAMVTAVAVSDRDAETRAALELFRTIRRRDRRARALWVSIAALVLTLATTLGLISALI